MRKTLFALAVLCLWPALCQAQSIPFPGPGVLAASGGGGGGGIAYISGMCDGAASGGDTFTSAASWDTTGANFIGLHVAYDQAATPVISDSKGNAYACLTLHEITGAYGSKICYKENATVGSGHTITITGTDHFASVCAKAFSGVDVSSAADQENGASRGTTGATTLATGSITPGVNNELILSGATWSNTTTIAVDSGLTITNQIDLSSGAHYGSALAHLVQTTATAINATWSNWNSGEGAADSIASFKAQPAAIAFVSGACAGAATGSSPSTISAIDTTGANFIVVSIVDYQPDSTALTDSKSNSVTASRTAYANSGSNRVQLHYYVSPTVGSGHTFTGTPATSSFNSICVAAFAVVKTTSPYDVENGATNPASAVTSFQPGSVTPSENNELLVTSLGWTHSDTVGVDLGFTIVDQVNLSAGNHYGNALAYKVQTTAAAQNPTWSWSSANGGIVATVASFKAQ